ncbi:MAG: hypothetical protein KUG56_03965 [Kordiimonadaceae bacterium]|nr:hypothetical protein [Kordiimonadaceae bacterium]
MNAARNTANPVRPALYGTWDKFIKAMQITLPITAVILGTVTMLWPFLNDNEVSFTLSTDDVAEGNSSVRMTNMRYVGTDAVNRLFEVEAASGFQDHPSAPRIKLSDIRASMKLDEAGPATVVARTGIYRTKESILSLLGGVELKTGNGYILSMAGAEIDLKNHLVNGQGTVKGVAELGTLEASKFAIIVDEEEAVFDGGVHLLSLIHI